jgi:CBS domain-containing protein
MDKTSLAVLLEEKNQQPATIDQEASLFDCVKKMDQLHIGSLFIVEGDKMLGMITERDVLYKGVVQQQNLANMKVKDVMTTHPVTVSPETSVVEAIAIITNKRIRHLPVVQDSKLLGMISIGDVTKHMMEYQQQHIEHLTDYISH